MRNALRSGAMLSALLATAACVPADPYATTGPPAYCRTPQVTALAQPLGAAGLAAARAQLQTHLDQGWPIDDPDAFGPGGRTFLHHYAARGDALMVDDLLAAGASVNAVDDAGETPLFAAVRGCHDGVADLLVRAGADPRAAVPASGDTPLAIARRTGQTRMLRILEGRYSTAPVWTAPAPRYDRYDDGWWRPRHGARPHRPHRPRPDRPRPPPGGIPPVIDDDPYEPPERDDPPDPVPTGGGDREFPDDVTLPPTQVPGDKEFPDGKVLPPNQIPGDR